MHTCPHCQKPLKIVVYPGKQAKAKNGSFQLATPLRAPIKEHDPFVRLITTLDGQMNIDELEITDSEFKRMAYAVSSNGWLFSKAALAKWGQFTDYRAQQIADILDEAGLRYVTSQNRSALLPRLMSHLRNARDFLLVGLVK